MKTLLVTGGGRGIGAATAKLAAERGYAVCINFHANQGAAEAVRENIESAGGRAIIARHLGIPFYVALPSSTIDPDCASGAEIPIEERDGDEVRWTWGDDDDGTFRRVRTTYAGCPVKNPAFDVTPAALVDGLVTEHGVFPASDEGVTAILAAAGRA